MKAIYISCGVILLLCVLISWKRHRASIKKSELFSNHGIVTNRSAQVGKSLETLASFISASAKKDVEKARAIFNWITGNIAYDVEGYKISSYGDNSAEGVLKRCKAVCEGYSNLFTRLSELVGLKTSVIHGYAKGYAY